MESVSHLIKTSFTIGIPYCCRVIIIIIIIIVLLFYFILENNIITILTFLNVDGAFILSETRRKTSVLLFVDSRFINDSDESEKMFVARNAKKIIQK